MQDKITLEKEISVNNQTDMLIIHKYIHILSLENDCGMEDSVKNKILNVALIGVGNMGKKYADMIVSGKVSDMKLTAIVIRRDELMEWGKLLVNIDGQPVKIFRSADEMFKEEADNIKNDGDFNTLYDAVIIVTPHKTHAELALKAFALGKDVLCDKPAASDIGEVLAMTEASKKYNRIYGMVFHQRLYSKYIKIKQMIDNGELGKLKRVCLINSRYLRTSHYHNSGSWRSSFAGEGGGALINQGQHILDMFQYLFGMPQRMFALIPFGKYNDFAVDDEDTIIMEYKDGMTASFILTTGEAVYEERMEIIGTKAKVLLEDSVLTITRHQDVEEYIKTENVNSRENMKFTEETIEFAKDPEPYIELFERFARSSIEHNDEYLVARGEEGINSLMLCAGAYYSACKNMPVELPLDKCEYKKLMDELIEKEHR